VTVFKHNKQERTYHFEASRPNAGDLKEKEYDLEKLLE